MEIEQKAMNLQKQFSASKFLEGNEGVFIKKPSDLKFLSPANSKGYPPVMRGINSPLAEYNTTKNSYLVSQPLLDDQDSLKDLTKSSGYSSHNPRKYTNILQQ